ncbi:hypothetical protein ABK040_013822 [Willaertia magna]
MELYQENTLKVISYENKSTIDVNNTIKDNHPTIPYINYSNDVSIKAKVNQFLTKKENSTYFQQILCRTSRIAFLTNETNELHYFIGSSHYYLEKPKNLKIYYMSGSYGHLMLLVDRITILNNNNETKTFKIETNNELYDHQLPNGEIIKVPRLFSVIAFHEMETKSVYGENKINLVPIGDGDIKTIYLLKDIEDVVNKNEFITYMGCAAKTSVFVTNLGRLFVCGANYFGDVGMGPGIDDISTVTLHKIFNERTDIYFVKVTSGDHNIIALTNDGRVFVCGYNSGNQLGVVNGGSEQVDLIESPQFCDHSEYIVDIASQYYAVVYLTKSGKLFTTDSSNSGEKCLVNIDIPNGFVPIKVSSKTHEFFVVLSSYKQKKVMSLGGNCFYNEEISKEIMVDNMDGCELVCSGAYHFAAYWAKVKERKLEKLMKQKLKQQCLVPSLHDIDILQ